MRAADLLVRALEHEGCRRVFGVPGEETLDLVDALRRSSIEFVVTRHEASAGFMAATVGRLTGKAGVALATLGPGATNLITAAAYAQLGAMPMLMITGQKPIKTSKQGHFQIVDVVDTMQPVVKYTRQIVHGNSVASHVREAMRIATDERPGAVHLELPEDIAGESTDDQFLFPNGKIRRPAADEKAVAQALAALRASRNPLILVGAGANRTSTGRMLQRFVERSGIPFFTTQMGKGVLDERQPLYLGTAARSDQDPVHELIDAADLIVNVGHDVVEKPPFFMRPGKAEVIHVNYSPAQVDPVYFPQHQVVGDVANALWQLAEGLTTEDRWRCDDLLAGKRTLDARSANDADPNGFPLAPVRIVRDVRAAMPDDGILTLDNGLYKLAFAQNYRAYAPNTVLLDNALACMGAGLPSAIAAKLVHPERKVVAVCGDGGFSMTGHELETAVRLGLDLTVLLLRDDAYGMIRHKQRQLNLPVHGTSFGNPDFVKLAEAYGAHGTRVESADALLPSLKHSQQTGGVHVLDVPIAY